MAQTSEALDFGGGDEVLFERLGACAVITLNRPEALNALTHRMVNAITRALLAWKDDSAVQAVIIKAQGRAFCAGGDLMLIYNSRANPQLDFFADEYRLNALIEAYPKPYVALINGIVMGGGVGVSFHGSHRVMTENATFAMPEVGIGFFPDVGASHFLPALGDNFGMYLGLTGTRVKWGDALASGLATHAVKAENLDPLLHHLATTGDVEGSLRQVSTMPPRETAREKLASIGRWFSHDTIGGIIAALESDAATDELARATLEIMRQKSPTSLAVAFRQLSAGRTMSMAECMRMEYRIVARMLGGDDFYEGIRTVLIDKGERPKWRPPTLDEVSPTAVDAYFSEAPGGDLLV